MPFFALPTSCVWRTGLRNGWRPQLDERVHQRALVGVVTTHCGDAVPERLSFDHGVTHEGSPGSRGIRIERSRGLGEQPATPLTVRAKLPITR